MIDLEMPDGQPVPVPLQLRTVRGRPIPAAPFQLDGRIAVGQPHVRQLTAADAGADEELARFIDAEAARWDYFLTALSCTFVSDGNEQLTEAWLRITLTSSGDSNDAPVGYSMDPLVLDEIRALPYTVKLVVPCVIHSEISVQGERTKRDVAVRALYEGTSNPAWVFSETSTKPLYGVQRLRLVVRVPAAKPANGSVEVGAKVRHRRFGTEIFSYSAPLADLPAALQIKFR